MDLYFDIHSKTQFCQKCHPQLVAEGGQYVIGHAPYCLLNGDFIYTLCPVYTPLASAIIIAVAMVI